MEQGGARDGEYWTRYIDDTFQLVFLESRNASRRVSGQPLGSRSVLGGFFLRTDMVDKMTTDDASVPTATVVGNKVRGQLLALSHGMSFDLHPRNVIGPKHKE